MTELPILDGEGWINTIDNTDQGEELTLPLDLLLMRGTMTVVGAETNVGKTAIGLQCFRWAVDEGIPSVYCTLEMSPALIFKRFHPQFGGEEACRDWIDSNDANISHSFLGSDEVEQIIRSKRYEFVVLDHIHELPFDGHEDLARKVKRLNALAPETGTAILALSQMKQRDPEFDTSPPSIYDFSYTKTIPDVASRAYVLWRPDAYEHTAVEMVMVKNRYGPVYQPVDLQLNKETITFERVSSTSWH